jgi:class 3 adenylate cyclase
MKHRVVSVESLKMIEAISTHLLLVAPLCYRKKRRVFKVETVGDCYVAVTGLPEPRKDHAVVMARFAHDCMYQMHKLTKKLEVVLGPDTGDLSMRFGLHSGPGKCTKNTAERTMF